MYEVGYFAAGTTRVIGGLMAVGGSVSTVVCIYSGQPFLSVSIAVAALISSLPVVLGGFIATAVFDASIAVQDSAYGAVEDADASPSNGSASINAGRGSSAGFGA
jgi:hypothetical protein